MSNYSIINYKTGCIIELLVQFPSSRQNDEAACHILL